MASRPKIFTKLHTAPPANMVIPDGVDLVGKDMKSIMEMLPPNPVTVQIQPTAQASGAGLAELNELITDSFLVMHEKLQNIEDQIRSLNDKVEKVEEARKSDYKALYNKLHILENKLSSDYTIKRVPVWPVQRVVAAKAIPGLPSQPPVPQRLVKQTVTFPLDSEASMEKLAEDATQVEDLLANLAEMFTEGKANAPYSMREWIDDNVLLEYSTTIDSDKKHIADSKFISMIRDTWINGDDYTLEQFEMDFENLLVTIQEEQTINANPETMPIEIAFEVED